MGFRGITPVKAEGRCKPKKSTEVHFTYYSAQYNYILQCPEQLSRGKKGIASKSIHSIRIFGWFSHFRMVFVHFRSTHFNEFLPTTGQGGNLFLPKILLV